MLYVICFCLGAALGLAVKSLPPEVRTIHKLLFVRTTKSSQRLVVVQFDNDGWQRAEDTCVDLLMRGKLRVAEMQAFDKFRERAGT